MYTCTNKNDNKIYILYIHVFSRSLSEIYVNHFSSSIVSRKHKEPINGEGVLKRIFSSCLADVETKDKRSWPKQNRLTAKGYTSKEGIVMKKCSH